MDGRPQSITNTRSVIQEEGDTAVPSQPSHHEDKIAATFGPNEWLVDELFEQYKADKNSVDKAWWDFFEDYSPAENPAGSTRSSGANGTNGTNGSPQGTQDKGTTGSTTSTTPPPPAPRRPPPPPRRRRPRSRRRRLPRRPPRRPPREGPREGPAKPVEKPAAKAPEKPADAPAAPAEDTVSPLRGPAARVVTNMEESLEVPTATSVRAVPAKLLVDNRIVINNHLKRARGGKVSFTHLIGFAVVEALSAMPSMNAAYTTDAKGKPAVLQPAHVNLGIAIDLPKPDGSRQLMVPAVKNCESKDFAEFWAAYEDVVRRARGGKLTTQDFAGTSISLTNPGTIGTVHSVPRLVKGQGAIIGVGAMEYPAEYQGASEETLTRLAVSKVITLTSTYDHRIIQGAGSGEFLRIVHTKLLGEDGFYDRVFQALHIPYQPIRWTPDISISHDDQINKTARLVELIHAFRVRGHLMADTDPLEYKQRMHPDLEIETHGLTLWDLDREFPTGVSAARRT